MSEREAEIARGVQTGLDQYASYDAAGEPHVSNAGKKVLSVSVHEVASDVSINVINREIPDATATFAVTPYQSAAPEASAIVKNSAGVLYGFVYVNLSAGTRYVMVANSATVPADGTAAPPLTFPVPSLGVLPFDTGKFGNYFSAGIVIWHSTTQATKTLGSADATFYVQKA